MKKLNLVLLLASTLFCFSGCGGSKDTNVPVLELDATLIEIETEKPFNFYDLVVAIDEEDGDIPEENIVLTSIGWTFIDGSYTPVEEDIGVHTVKYEVSDKAGNKAEPVYVDVTVVKGWKNRELVKEYDLSEVNMNGWKSTFASGNSGEIKVNKNALTLNVKENTSTNYSDIGLVKESEQLLLKDVEYTFEMDVSSSINTNFKFQIVDLEDNVVYENESTANTTASHYSVKFTPSADVNGYEYNVLVGNNSGTFDFTLDNIVLNYNIESFRTLVADMDEDYLESTGTYKAYNHMELASDAENRYLTWDKTSVSLNINFGCYNAWNSGIQRKIAANLVKDKSYLVEFDIYTESSDYRFELNFGLQDALTDLDCQKVNVKPSGQVKKGQTIRYSTRFTSNIDLDEFSMYIKNFSLESGNPGTSKVTVKNFKLAEIRGSKGTYKEVFLPNNFQTWNFDGGEGSLYTENGNMVYEITKFGTEDKHNKMAIASFSAQEGKLYTLTFSGYASEDISCVIFFSEVENWDNGQPINSTADFTTNEREFTYTATFPITQSGVYEILWQFGGLYKPETCKITFTSVAMWVQG